MFAYWGSDGHGLRLLTEADVDELFALTDANRTHLKVWLPWLDETRSPADTRRFIHLTQQQWADNTGLVAAITDRDRIAGVIGYNQFDWQNRIGAIGYWLGAAYQGRGLMTAACQALVNYGFETLNLNRIVIACATQNARSRAIPERLGFHHEGTARDGEWLYDHFVDLEVYACLRRHWDRT